MRKTTTAVNCDKCGKDISTVEKSNEQRFQLTVYRQSRNEGYMTLDDATGISPIFDLCFACYNKLGLEIQPKN